LTNASSVAPGAIDRLDTAVTTQEQATWISSSVHAVSPLLVIWNACSFSELRSSDKT
jgi:hypothetical protein